MIIPLPSPPPPRPSPFSHRIPNVRRTARPEFQMLIINFLYFSSWFSCLLTDYICTVVRTASLRRIVFAFRIFLSFCLSSIRFRNRTASWTRVKWTERLSNVSLYLLRTNDAKIKRTRVIRIEKKKGNIHFHFYTTNIEIVISTNIFRIKCVT